MSHIATILTNHLKARHFFPALVLVVSCQIAEPDLIVGTHTGEPAIAIVQFDNFDPSRVYAGFMGVRIPFSFSSPDIIHMDLFLDSMLVQEYVDPGETVVLDLRAHSNGEHALILAVFKTSGPGGVLGLLGAPSEILVSPLLIDNSPPTPVQNLSIQWETNPTITWSQSMNANFYSYVIRRHDPVNEAFMSIVGVNSLRTETSFTDTEISPMYGRRAVYSVATSNGYEAVNTSTVSRSYGVLLPVSGSYQFLDNPVIEEVYAIRTGGLDVVSRLTQKVLRQFPLEEYMDPGAPLQVSADGTRFFYLRHDTADTSYTVRVHNVQTFALEAEWPVPFKVTTAAVAAGPGNDLYMFSNNGYVLKFNGLTGEVTDSTGPFSQLNHTRFTVSRDRSQLILLRGDPSSMPSTTFTRMALSAGAPAVMQSRTFNALGYDIAIDSAFSVGAISWGDRVEIINAMTFSTVTTLYPPVPSVPGSLSLALVVYGGRLYLGHQKNFETGQLVEIQIADGTVQRIWDFVQIPPSTLHRPSGHAQMYAINAYGTPWIIPL